MLNFFSSFKDECVECKRIKKDDDVWVQCHKCIIPSSYCPDCMIRCGRRTYCPRCVTSCKKCNKRTIAYTRPVCDGCVQATSYCLSCMVECDSKMYCPACVTKCQNCDRYTINRSIPLCKQCIHYSVREIMECLSPDSPHKNKLPFIDLNYKLVLSRPLLERPLITIFKSHVSWSFIEDTT